MMDDEDNGENDNGEDDVLGGWHTTQVLRPKFLVPETFTRKAHVQCILVPDFSVTRNLDRV